MTLTELKYIIAVAQSRHFGKAAEACFVSQPTLSVAIKKLEDKLGVSIFERAQSEIRITPIGDEIIKQAQKVLDEAAEIKTIAAGGKDQLNSPLRIGAIYTVGPYLFPHLVPALRKIAPEMKLHIVEGLTADLRNKLLQGELDAIIISLPFTESGVLTQKLYSEEFSVLMPNDHKLASKTSITSKTLSKQELLLLGEGHCFRDQIISACPDCITNPAHQETVEGTSLETIRHMVASGLGITILPNSATQIEYYKNRLCTKPFSNPVPKRDVALAWRVSFTRPKAIGALQKALKHCNSLLKHVSFD